MIFKLNYKFVARDNEYIRESQAVFFLEILVFPTTPQSSVTGASPNLTAFRYGRLNDSPYTYVHKYYHLTVVCFCIVAQTVCDCLLSLAV